MARARQVKLEGGRTVTVRELTVGEIIDWEEDIRAGNAPTSAVDNYLLVEMRLSDLTRFTDLEEDELNDLAMSDIDDLLLVAKELNARFFDMLARLIQSGQRIMEAAKQSKEPSASL